MSNTEKLLSVLENISEQLKKTQTNIKKCPKQRITKGYLNARLQAIETNWSNYTGTYLELVKCTTREQKSVLPYFENEEYSTHEDLYIWLISDIKDQLESMAGSSSDRPCCDHSIVQGHDSKCQPQVRLPKIELPSFSGNYEDWPAFKDLFLSLVHENANLSSTQKLHYLKSSLSGEAAALLKHIQITENNYLQAWDVLKVRYGNKRLIVCSLLKRFMSQKKCSTQTSTQLKSLLDTTNEVLNSLQNLNVTTDSWDPLITYIIVQKLDQDSHKEWEEFAFKENQDELSTWSDLQKFLECKYRTLEMIAPNSKIYTKTFFTTTEDTEGTGRAYHSRVIGNMICSFCKQDDHYLFSCKEFINLSVIDRRDFVKNKKLCFNCLLPTHLVFKCKQKKTCRICRRKHHSLLHINNESQSEVLQPQRQPEPTNTITTAHFSHPGRHVLLATALVEVQSENGHKRLLRALIDQGSEASFISENMVQMLRLKKINVNGEVSGVEGSIKIPIKHKVQFRILSRVYKEEEIGIEAYILQNISSMLPSRQITTHWTEKQTIQLADPTYYTPGRIDLLLGADVFCKIIQEGLVKMSDGVVAQKTTLGWILSGKKEDDSPEGGKHSIKTLHITKLVEEDNDMLRRFWEIEQDLYKKKKILTKEELQCEDIYKTTTQRDNTGRYTVHLPLKQSIEDTIKLCGDTREQAERRFHQLERRFRKNKTLKEEYSKVIKEYIDMGHMKLLEERYDHTNTIFLPHHAVIRQDKETTKVRVVFDASAKGSNNASLNDAMMTGPVLQKDLRSLITLWRTHKICFVGDIMKMYRMINLHEDHTKLQCLVWRDEESEILKGYKLTTVTFGTAAAPFLAVRTLMQLADDEADIYTEAATAIKESFYVDDLMGGHKDVEGAKQLCQDIKILLKKGGFIMQKWSSNSEEVLEHIREDKAIKENLEIKLDTFIKILGLTWDRRDDSFKITIDLPKLTLPVTKRSILSDVSRLFDPFGWLSPVIIVAKVLIQKLWLCNLGWDDELPEDIVEDWKEYRNNLPELQPIEVPRWFHTSPENKEIQIHGFADASVSAYAAVTYLRVVDEEDEVHVTMIASRTRVAPIKQLSIPRLELCAAALLADLLEEVADLFKIPVNQIHAYTDSMVVLSWLQAPPNRWQTFVANRVAGILRILNPCNWSHIQSTENPADIASRGIRANELKKLNIWWKGPEWLRQKDIIPKREVIPETRLEMKTSLYTNITTEEERPIWERFSNLSRMKRVLSYCRRMLSNKDGVNRKEYITTEEMETVLESCIKYYQHLTYGREIEDLKKEGKVKARSPIISLSPFLDKNEILRVGGRLENASLLESGKHPTIIPQKVHLTKLIVQEAHVKTLHGGIQLMMTYIRSRFWVINLKNAVKHCVRTCKICIIDKAKVKTQKMGQLPAVRVNQHRAFLNTGVDYAGPVYLRTSKGRGHHATKGYICLFVCMATKAIHLEAVTDLSTQAFLAAFRRFVARRGRCSNLWSDNATNFIGAARELKDLFRKGKANITNEVAASLANEGTQWHNIPPKMPNHGGLWESGVRSVKRHLVRVNGTTKLTYEEMSTLLAQIEACLNSRPLCQLDETIDTLTPLTPGHFLIGEPLVGVPDISYENKSVSLLSKWNIIQKMTEAFWKRWKCDYLHTMQQRYKWHSKLAAPNIGDIFIVKEDDLPPSKWMLGRVLQVHPGTDNLVRVVTLRCKGNNSLKRPLSKLIPLPTEPEM